MIMATHLLKNSASDDLACVHCRGFQHRSIADQRPGPPPPHAQPAPLLQLPPHRQLPRRPRSAPPRPLHAQPRSSRPAAAARPAAEPPPAAEPGCVGPRLCVSALAPWTRPLTAVVHPPRNRVAHGGSPPLRPLPLAALRSPRDSPQRAPRASPQRPLRVSGTQSPAHCIAPTVHRESRSTPARIPAPVPRRCRLLWKPVAAVLPHAPVRCGLTDAPPWPPGLAARPRTLR